MAVFYTNNLTGNDTTGDGSWANPYKSIYRGTQALAANGDEVRVVGSGYTDLSGTLTFTYNSATVTTSADLTAAFPELTSTAGNNKVIITVNDEFGFGKSVFVVTAVTTTTLTLATVWPGGSGSFNGKRLTTQHYYATTTPVSPLANSGTFEAVDTAKLALYTDLKITGGWTADGVQDGITAFVSAHINGTTSTNRVFNQALVGSFSNLQNLYFSGFAMANLGSFHGVSGNNHAIGSFWFIRCSGMFNSSSTGIVNKTSEVANIYAYDTRSNESWQVSSSPTLQLNMNFWHSIINISSGQFPPLNGNVGSDPTIPAKRFDKIYVRRIISNSLYDFANTGYFLGNASFSSFPLLINELHVWNNNPGVDGTMFPILGSSTPNSPVTNGFWLKKFYGYGKVGLTGSGFHTYATIGDGTQSLNDLRLCSLPGFTTSLGYTARNWRVKTTEGNWRLYGSGPNAGNSTYNSTLVREELVEKVTGANSLAIAAARKYPGQTSSVSGIQYNIAYIPAFKSSKTLTLKMKTNGISTSQWASLTLRVMYSNDQQLELWTTSLTGLSSSWQDFTYTIDLSAATFSDEITSLDLMIGQNLIADTYTGGLLYIDSISLT